jgi:predicted ribosomally synthesized peptide with nif11-like leader
MSVQDAKTFVERVLEDEEFARQLVKLETDGSRAQFAREAGYEFTPDDVQQLLPSGITVEQLRGLEVGDELPDEIMEAVVGGKSDGEKMITSVAVEIAVEAVVVIAASAF